MKHALTIDLEDWYHPELVRKHVGDKPKPRIEQATRKILKLLDQHQVKATFFVLGDVARKHPKLIQEIEKEGHEIASHGMTHRPLWELTESDFDRELKDFSKLMKKILKNKTRIIGFRAPTFSIDERTKYGLKILLDNGYKYDSSIFPLKNPVYGVSGAPVNIYKPDLKRIEEQDDRGKLVEFPLTVFEWKGWRIPAAGGFYLRILPYFVFKWMLEQIEKDKPAVIYFHPWEMDKQIPRLSQIGVVNFLITYWGIEGFEGKIGKLLNDFEFETMSQVINQKNESRVENYFDECADRFDSFYGEVAKRNWLETVAHEVLRKPGMVRRFETTMKVLGKVKGITILDIGCGSGIYAIYLAQLGAKVTGIDFSKTMIRLAKRNAKQGKVKVKWLEKDLLTFTPKQNFEHSLMIGVFDYVCPDKREKYLTNAAKITNEKLIATFPKAYAFQRPIRTMWLASQNCPVYFYWKQEIEALGKKCKLKTKFYDCGPIWTVVFEKL